MAAPKKGLFAILAGGDEPSAEEGGNAVQSALKDLAAAMKSGNWAAAETAFRDAKAACEADYEAEGDEDEGLSLEG